MSTVVSNLNISGGPVANRTETGVKNSDHIYTAGSSRSNSELLETFDAFLLQAEIRRNIITPQKVPARVIVSFPMSWNAMRRRKEEGVTGFSISNIWKIHLQKTHLLLMSSKIPNFVSHKPQPCGLQVVFHISSVQSCTITMCFKVCSDSLDMTKQVQFGVLTRLESLRYSTRGSRVSKVHMWACNLWQDVRAFGHKQ